jgi:hypothetical protein
MLRSSAHNEAGSGISRLMESRLSLQVVSRHLAGLAVLDQFVADLLTIIEATHSGALDSGNMHEHIGAAVIRLDEAKALRCIEPFDGTSGHSFLPIVLQCHTVWHCPLQAGTMLRFPT